MENMTFILTSNEIPGSMAEAGPDGHRKINENSEKSGKPSKNSRKYQILYRPAMKLSVPWPRQARTDIGKSTKTVKRMENLAKTKGQYAIHINR